MESSTDPQPRGGRSVPYLLLGGGLFIAAMGCVGLLKALPYSTSQMSAAAPGEARRPPADSVRLGPLEWPVAELAAAPGLEPFRTAFHQSCGARIGIAAATCVSIDLAHRFPNGKPRTEFFNSSFDPNDHLRRHLAGEPGHCVNRS